VPSSSLSVGHLSPTRSTGTGSPGSPGSLGPSETSGLSPWRFGSFRDVSRSLSPDLGLLLRRADADVDAELADILVAERSRSCTQLDSMLGSTRSASSVSSRQSPAEDLYETEREMEEEEMEEEEMEEEEMEEEEMEKEMEEEMEKEMEKEMEEEREEEEHKSVEDAPEPAKQESGSAVSGGAEKGGDEQHAEEEREDDELFCPQADCEESFFEKWELDMHMAVDHVPIATINCPWEGCSRSFAREKGLQLHMRQHTDEPPSSRLRKNRAQTSVWQSGAHGRSEVRKLERQAHTSAEQAAAKRKRPAKKLRWIQGGVKYFACPHGTCPKVFSQNGALRAHLQACKEEMWAGSESGSPS